MDSFDICAWSMAFVGFLAIGFAALVIFSLLFEGTWQKLQHTKNASKERK